MATRPPPWLYCRAIQACRISGASAVETGERGNHSAAAPAGAEGANRPSPQGAAVALLFRREPVS